MWILPLLGFFALNGCGYILEQIASKSSSTQPPSIKANFSLKDPLTLSVAETHQATVTVVISDDEGATKWCVSETQEVMPSSATSSCVGGVGASSGWSSTRPTSMTLTDPDGMKTVRLWVATDAGAVSTVPVSSEILLNRTAPTATVTNCPASPSSTANLNVDIAGVGVVEYIYKLGVVADCSIAGGYSSQFTA
ncbi:MAG: hypothetical protein K2X47_07360, partial [Bdellovibrionales bacterium]|nr:hypothetical protein [Bdellovibrionales bacterium]